MRQGGLSPGGPREPLLLALGGIHVFAPSADCRLTRVEPPGALEDLKWAGQLAVKATGEGEAELRCGPDTVPIQIVRPARLDIILVDGDPRRVRRGDHLIVRAKPYGAGGQDLEPGKLTSFGWASSSQLQPDNDRSSAEFGFGAALYGMYTFRAVDVGQATITAHLGEAQGRLDLVITG